MDKWVKCPYCGHKLFRVVAENAAGKIEIKCSSCKHIFELSLDFDKKDGKMESEKGG